MCKRNSHDRTGGKCIQNYPSWQDTVYLACSHEDGVRETTCERKPMNIDAEEDTESVLCPKSPRAMECVCVCVSESPHAWKYKEEYHTFRMPSSSNFLGSNSMTPIRVVSMARIPSVNFDTSNVCCARSNRTSNCASLYHKNTGITR